MKKVLYLFLILSVLLVGCATDTVDESSAPVSAESVSSEAESSAEETSSEESVPNFMETAPNVISTLDYENTGKMGDQDGPAFAVYSNIGYTGASAIMDVENMEIDTVMKGGKFINAYCFFGVDVYDDSGTWWQNCVDVGLCWSGRYGGWHLFYNMYEPLNEGTPTWYESRIKLPKDDIYEMSMTITEDNYATLTIKGQKTGKTDSVTLEVKGARADGKNTAMLFNVALDYPPDTKVDREGNPCEDWTEITLANSDKGLFFRNFHVWDLKLYKGETASDWTDDLSSAVSIWPDKAVEGFDYSPTQVGLFGGAEYVIDLDMNRE